MAAASSSKITSKCRGKLEALLSNGLFHVVHQVYYYSAQVKSRALTILPLVCWMCGETNTLPIPPEKLQEFQCFHPVCHGEKTAKEEAAKKEAAKEEAAKEEAVKEDETRIR
ncbi:hypothetical protein Bbelb_100800 [Branchiostoma belcheri]|nr:hypothetical protein Bbelb_100800 [Branchiostoma belcheri]